MNDREKKLLTIIGGMVGLVLLFLIGRSVFLKPLIEIDRRIAGVREKLDRLAKDRRDYFAAEDEVKAVATRTFSDDIDQASARFGEMLTRTLINSGLREADFSRLPTGTRKIRGALETGWTVRGDGPLHQVVSLIFLLDRATPVHRLDGLTLSPSDAPGRVKVSFRYLTLVPTPCPEVERGDLNRVSTPRARSDAPTTPWSPAISCDPTSRAPPRHHRPDSHRPLRVQLLLEAPAWKPTGWSPCPSGPASRRSTSAISPRKKPSATRSGIPLPAVSSSRSTTDRCPPRAGKTFSPAAGSSCASETNIGPSNAVAPSPNGTN